MTSLKTHLKPLSSQKLYQQAASQLADAIRRGVWGPGAKLPSEMELAGAFGVSRASVREALRALEVLGIVQSRRGLGSYVAPVVSSTVSSEILGDLARGANPEELLEARIIAEPDIAALAAARRAEEDLAEMRNALGTMYQSLDRTGRPTTHEAWYEADLRFHLAIAKATANDSLVGLMQHLVERRGRAMWRQVAERMKELPGVGAVMTEQHESIYRAIEGQDSREARRAMLEHLCWVGGNLLAIKKKGPRRRAEPGLSARASPSPQLEYSSAIATSAAKSSGRGGS